MLGSYELVPGTVVYAGYGSVFERKAWERPDENLGYLATTRGLFFKASYLKRF